MPITPHQRNVLGVREVLRFMTAADLAEAAGNPGLPKWAREIYAAEGERRAAAAAAPAAEPGAILPTENEAYGFWGTMLSNYGAEPQARLWTDVSRFLMDRHRLTAAQARKFMDSRMGRHLADDLSFAPSRETPAVLAHLGASTWLAKAIRQELGAR